jgi:predicted GH43/DUF377 family glycosyl hydrolase
MLFKRYQQKPILSAKDWPYKVHAVFNPAALKIESGETLLLCRVEDFRGISHFCAARSENGLDNWKIDPKPTMQPDIEVEPAEAWGIQDPRAVWIEEVGYHFVTYTAFSRWGPCVSLARTEDFKEFRRAGVILPPHSTDAAIFPREISGKWAMLHRPGRWEPESPVHIWISFSENLVHWGEHRVVLEARSGGWWDSSNIGLAASPIETEKGWLILYHAIHESKSGSLFRIGAALLDLEDPRMLIRRGREWLFGPEESYELTGDAGGVIFSCGAVLDKDSNQLRMYYGAADSTIALATAGIDDILGYLLDSPG